MRLGGRGKGGLILAHWLPILLGVGKIWNAQTILTLN